jgi:hypothetical protein
MVLSHYGFADAGVFLSYARKDGSLGAFDLDAHAVGVYHRY